MDISSFLSEYINENATMIILISIIAIMMLVFISKIDRSITALLHWNRSDKRRDSKRVYTSKQKQLASKMCKNRCEGTGILSRCKYRGRDLQGDHWYPYARGGATTIQNLVMLCPSCNKSKSDKIPSRFQTFALRKRRKYGYDYMGEIPTKVGQWLPYTYNNEKI